MRFPPFFVLVCDIFSTFIYFQNRHRESSQGFLTNRASSSCMCHFACSCALCWAPRKIFNFSSIIEPAFIVSACNTQSIPVVNFALTWDRKKFIQGQFNCLSQEANAVHTESSASTHRWSNFSLEDLRMILSS